MVISVIKGKGSLKKKPARTHAGTRDREADGTTKTSAGVHLINGCQQSDMSEGSTIATPIRDIPFYWELATCENPEDLREQVGVLLRGRGFSDFSFALVEAYLYGSASIMSTQPQLLRAYMEQGFGQHDLVVQHALINTTPIFHSAVAGFIGRTPFITRGIQRNLELMTFYRERGFHDFFNIPLSTYRSQGNALFSVTSRDTSRSEFAGRVEHYHTDLLLLARTIDQIAGDRFSGYFDIEDCHTKVSVNPRPLKLLETLAYDNLSLAEAADKLCISIHTANKHIATAKRALGAKTQAAAIYLAIKRGLIGRR